MTKTRVTYEVDRKVKPFVKWAGGKRQIIDELVRLMPDNFNRYFEPFVGAGALFFELAYEPSIIVDINDDLITTYKVIKNDLDKLIKLLRKHKKNNSETYFYKVRGLWTRKTKELGIAKDELCNVHDLSPVEQAARFIYLNKTCYNGLYRLNSNGEFNVPFGHYKNPIICDQQNLVAVHKLLQNTNIYKADFTIIKDEFEMGKGDFTYFDPPYVPLSKTSNFTSYTKNGFDKEDQLRLLNLFQYIDKQGGYCMLSNSNTEFVRKKYNDFNIYEVKAIRAINSDADKRGEISELIITNY